MSEKSLPAEKQRFDLQVYKRPANPKDLTSTHVAFSGAPQKHPNDPQKVVLVADPYSNDTFYYEFKVDSIAYAEKLPNLVDATGTAVSMARIWVKKGSLGLRCAPFVVEDTSAVLKKIV